MINAQHAHIYRIHTLHFIFGEIIIGKILSIQPRPVGSPKHISVSSVQNPICHQGIFVSAEIVHCEMEIPTRMILIQIVKNMINETIESFNCCASLHSLFVPTHSANIIAAN